MTVAYRIQDEPIGGAAAARLRSIHSGLLLALMFGGAGLPGAIAFAVNAWLLRGPTWGREVGLAIAILIGAPAILFGLAMLRGGGMLPELVLQYAMLPIIAWKLGLAYWIFFCSRPHTRSINISAVRARECGQVASIGAVLVMAGGYSSRPSSMRSTRRSRQIMVN